MATCNFDDDRIEDGHIVEGPAMAHDNPTDTAVDAEMDKISVLPDDVLLDILGRLALAGDVRAVARTSILSRRWRSLPWPQIPDVFLDVGKFVHSDGEWTRVRRRGRRRRRFWEQDEHHEATVALTGALARFLAAPPSQRVIERLSLKFILTRRGYLLRRIGELVGAAADAGAVKNVEVVIATEMESVAPAVEAARTKLGYGERFRRFRQDCPGAFRSLTKLALQDLWFHGPAELNSLVRGCNALRFLSLSSCDLLPKTIPPAMDDGGGGGGEPPRAPPALTIDAPQSRLQVLLCDLCRIGGVELVQAPELGTFRYRAVVLGDSPPISFGYTPLLNGLCLGHYQDEDGFVKLKLSELLVKGGGHLEHLRLAFDNGKTWLQPERPRHLRAALRGLKYLTLFDLSPECNLSWATFLLEAAPLLETLNIHICNHICIDSWHKKGDEDASLAWEAPSPYFRHHHLKQLCLTRAFHVEKDLPFARLVMGLAVNLQAVTLGVKSLRCQKCIDAQLKYQELARSRLRFTQGSEYVDAFVKELTDSIVTSAKITLLLPDPV